MRVTILAASLAGLAGFAHATPMIAIAEAGYSTNLVFADNSLTDADPALGAMAFDGDFGTYHINITAVLGGTAGSPAWDFSGTATSLAPNLLFSPSYLRLNFSANNFGPTNGNVTSRIFGTSPGIGSRGGFPPGRRDRAMNETSGIRTR